MPLIADGGRLSPIRTGKFAELASSLAWFAGLIATYLTPLGLVVAGLLLGLTASSWKRAFAAGAAFGITVVGAGAVWLALGGSLPIGVSLAPALVAFVSLVVPPVAAVALRSVI
jgi:hypothetical protein